MRLNPVNALIAVLLGAVLSYGLWSLDGPLRNYVAAGSAIFFIATLLPLLLGGYASARRGVNLRVVSGVFFGIAQWGICFVKSTVFIDFFGHLLYHTCAAAAGFVF